MVNCPADLDGVEESGEQVVLDSHQGILPTVVMYYRSDPNLAFSGDAC